MEAGASGRSGEELFGRLVAVRRAGLGLSQEDLAARIDTSRASVARIEEGQPPSPKMLRRLASALNSKPETGAPSSRTRIWNLEGEERRLAIAVLIPMLVILAGAFSVGVHSLGGVGRSSGADGGNPSQSPRAVSAPLAVPALAAGGAQAETRKTKKSQKTKRSEKKRATPAAPVSEPSFAPPPPRKKSSPATIQPANEPAASAPAPSKPVATAPAPSSDSGGGSNAPPPQAGHGIGGGEAWHGIAPGGG